MFTTVFKLIEKSNVLYTYTINIYNIKTEKLRGIDIYRNYVIVQ
jgi:hypothetical protein